MSQLQSGDISAEKACTDALERAQKTNETINAFIEIYPEAIEQARALDQKASTKKGSLWGVPVAIKDNFCLQGRRTTAASAYLDQFHSPYTAFCVEQWQKQGAIIIGKTNMDEFGMGSNNENSYYGACKNPWDLQKSPGGSSGGSAAAVAAGIVPLALGTDTGGSIRQPAAFCGLVGIKPSYGRVSRYGLVSFASSLDQAGVFALSVDQAAIALDPIMCRDLRDATQPQLPPVETQGETSLKGLRLGLPQEFMDIGLSSELKGAMEELIHKLKDKGVELVPVSLPHSPHAVSVYHIIAACEASSNLARYDGVRYGHRLKGQEQIKNLETFYKNNRSSSFGQEVQRRILLGTYALSAESYDSFYLRAAKVRRLITQDFDKAFKVCDAIIGPVSIGEAFPLGEHQDNPVACYDNDLFTTPASLAGLPAMSLPLALTKKGLPLGLQLIAPRFQEAELIKVGRQLEKVCDFRRPDVFSL